VRASASGVLVRPVLYRSYPFLTSSTGVIVAVHLGCRCAGTGLGLGAIAGRDASIAAMLATRRIIHRRYHRLPAPKLVLWAWGRWWGFGRAMAREVEGLTLQSTIATLTPIGIHSPGALRGGRLLGFPGRLAVRLPFPRGLPGVEADPDAALIARLLHVLSA